MPSLHLLGTGAAVSDPHRATTMLAIDSDAGLLAIDCGGDLIQRMLQADLDPLRLEALILTHEHPDHVGGFPLFMEKIWLLGRRDPIPVIGIPEALAQARTIFESFDTHKWEGLPEIDWREIDPTEDAPFHSNSELQLRAAPGDHHGIPVFGIRAETNGGGVLTYSCDTVPCDSITELARDADLLVHEATGDFPGHSSALQAARVAARARAKRLLLIHLPPESLLPESELAEAREVFPDTAKGEELGRHEF